MRNPFKVGTAESFFWKHAGYSHGAEGPAAGRKRCALSLARAERDGQARGFVFSWEHDDQTDASFRDTDAPYSLWSCRCHGPNDAALSSCGGIDLGPDLSAPYEYGVSAMGGPKYKGGRDTYCRVMEAELAAEALADFPVPA